MQYRQHTAQEASRRLETLISAMWNSKDPCTRFAMRRAFHGIKPGIMNFLVNTSLMIHEKQKDPKAYPRVFLLQYTIDFPFDGLDAAVHRRFCHAQRHRYLNNAMAGNSKIKNLALILGKVAQLPESVALRLCKLTLEVKFVLHRTTPFNGQGSPQPAPKS